MSCSPSQVQYRKHRIFHVSSLEGTLICLVLVPLLCQSRHCCVGFASGHQSGCEHVHILPVVNSVSAEVPFCNDTKSCHFLVYFILFRNIIIIIIIISNPKDQSLFWRWKLPAPPPPYAVPSCREVTLHSRHVSCPPHHPLSLLKAVSTCWLLASSGFSGTAHTLLGAGGNRWIMRIHHAYVLQQIKQWPSARERRGDLRGEWPAAGAANIETWPLSLCEE